MKDTLLDVGNLKITFQNHGEKTIAIDGISFQLAQNETLGIVGESGSGKSVSSLAIMGLIPTPPGNIENGSIQYESYDLKGIDEQSFNKIRGSKIAMIFQEPMTALNPSQRCGKQVDEMLRLHTDLNKDERKERIISLFERVKLPDPDRAYQAYPHQLSGGQLQRIMIAMAISCNPQILIADEPTTALDVTVQREIIALLQDLKNEYGNSMIFISHDLGVIAELTDRVLVMNRGKIVERGSTQDVFSHPKESYTKGLLACRPPMNIRYKRLPTVQDFINRKPQVHESYVSSLIETDEQYRKHIDTIKKQDVLLSVQNIVKEFPKKKSFLGRTMSTFRAVDDVSFDLRKKSCLGLVGESGCGKSTLAKVIMRLIKATSGQVVFDGQDIFQMRDEALRKLRKDFQIIFQDPYSSLNPRMTIGKAIQEPMSVHGLHAHNAERKEKVIDLLEKVGLSADHYHRYPHQFSGGQRQRICIARALGLEPKFILCDESVSALDVSVQAQVLNLLKDLQAEFDLSYLFISHDLSVIKFISDHVLVMRQGKIVESGEIEAVINNPQKEYTQKLISSIL